MVSRFVDSNLPEDKPSEVGPCDTPIEVSDMEGIFPMDLMVIPEERFSWTAEGFRRAVMSRQFGLTVDSPSPFFHSRVQYQLYRGGIDIRLMHPDQQWLH